MRSQMFELQHSLHKVKSYPHILGLTCFIRIIFKMLNLEYVLQEHLNYLFFFEFTLIPGEATRIWQPLFFCHTFHAVITSSWEYEWDFFGGGGGVSAGTYLNFCHILSKRHIIEIMLKCDNWQLRCADMNQDSEWSPRQSRSHLMLPTLALAEGA